MNKKNKEEAIKKAFADNTEETAKETAPKEEPADKSESDAAAKNAETEKEPEQQAEKEAAAEDPARALAILKVEKEALQKSYDECNDRYLRMMAEYDNFRRRAQKEREGAYGDAYADALKTILPVFDNLERALQFVDGTADDKLASGVSMTINQFSEALTKMGVEVFGEAGETFDPQIHNAVMHVEDESQGEGIITEVFQKGYRKGDKIIRFAMVKVAN